MRLNAHGLAGFVHARVRQEPALVIVNCEVGKLLPLAVNESRDNLAVLRDSHVLARQIVIIAFDGFPLGGTALLFNQTEVRFPLIGENIGGVIFHDMGNVFSGVRDISFRVRQHDLQDFDYMVHSVGIGFRYRTPVGPARLDLAWSINPPSFFGFKGTQQELINAGVNPCATSFALCQQQNVRHFQWSLSLGQAF